MRLQKRLPATIFGIFGKFAFAHVAHSADNIEHESIESNESTYVAPFIFGIFGNSRVFHEIRVWSEDPVTPTTIITRTERTERTLVCRWCVNKDRTDPFAAYPKLWCVRSVHSVLVK